MENFIKLHVDFNNGYISGGFSFSSIEDAFKAIKDGKLHPIENVDLSCIDVYYSYFIDGNKRDGILGSYSEVEDLDFDTFKNWLNL